MKLPVELEGWAGNLALRVYELLAGKMANPEFGMISLDTTLGGSNVNFAEADTWYPITGIFNVDEALLNNFELTPDGRLTYKGEFTRVVIGGTTDVSIDGTTEAKVTYGLFKNNELLPRAKTPHDFDRFSLTENFSITGADIALNGDVYQVKAMCSDAGRTITLSTLNVIFA